MAASLEAGRLRDADLFSELCDILVPALFVVHSGEKAGLAAHTETPEEKITFIIGNLIKKIYESKGSKQFKHKHDMTFTILALS